MLRVRKACSIKSKGKGLELMKSESAEASRVIRVTDIGEFIRHKSCARRFALGYGDGALFHKLPFARLPINTMDPVLAAQGKAREEAWGEALERRGFVGLEGPKGEEGEGRGMSWEHFVWAITQCAPPREVFAREVQVEACIGTFRLFGRIDFMLLRWRENGEPVLHLVECKASRKDKTYQRLQVVLYRMMLERIFQDAPLLIQGHLIKAPEVHLHVVRIDGQTNEMMGLDDLPVIASSEAMEQDILSLLRPGGTLDALLDEPLEALPFCLEAKCDDCQFHQHCFAESSRLRRLELLSLPPDVTQSLREAGVDTIDALCDLPLSGSVADTLRRDPDFFADLQTLQTIAKARRATLPAAKESQSTDSEVVSLPNRGFGQLPEHRQPHPCGSGQTPLMRIFLDIHYDYVEDRIVALAAHLTRSEHQLHTRFVRTEEGRSIPAPEVVELRTHPGQNAKPSYEIQALTGETIVHIKQGQWSGHYLVDCAMERELLQTFFGRLVEAMQVSGARTKEAHVPVHFYLFGAGGMKTLMDACGRVGGNMLGYVRELFGCRDTLEQLMYSDLSAEIASRYAWGWTGRGLSVLTSLRWFGRRFHWLRQVGGQPVALDQQLRRDVFDFRRDLHLDGQNQWVPKGTPASRAVTTEVRSRFHDSLPAPYVHAFWGTLQDPDGDEASTLPSFLIAPLRDYQRAAAPGVLRAYLHARVEAMRWLEERVMLKNRRIQKVALHLKALPQFKLETTHPARAALDYLRFDQHVKFHEWLQTHLVPPHVRIAKGESVPIEAIVALDKGGQKLSALLNPTPYFMDLETLRRRASIDQGKMVRLSPLPQGPDSAQTPKDLITDGRTAIVEALDWDSGHLVLSIIPAGRHSNPYYTLPSRAYKDSQPPSVATLDASITNFVDARVERRLSPQGAGGQVRGASMLQWFDPVHPQIPPQPALDPELTGRLRQGLERLRLGSDALLDRRVEIILAGLSSRVQLIQGPPGTGKTTVSAVAILTRIAARHSPGTVVLVAAHTHTAVETLLRRIDGVLDAFVAAASPGHPEASLRVACCKVYSSLAPPPTGGRVRDLSAKNSASTLKKLAKDHVVILGSTTSTLLKMIEDLDKRAAYSALPQGFQTPFLVVDEASMMVCAHLLSLVTCLEPNGELLLAGDHRQLSPIMAHNWGEEDRPPAQLYRMHESAFEAIARMRLPHHHGREDVQLAQLDDRSIRLDGLEVTYRLPASIRALIQPLYDRDGLHLKAPASSQEAPRALAGRGLDAVWRSSPSLYLVAHQERESSASNEFEAYLARHLIDAGLDAGLIATKSIAVVTPHRAQRALLRQVLADHGQWINVIDTVERLQGGEAETIVFCATVSQPTALSQETEFILSLERSNVAFSRTKRRLIVIASQTLLDFVPPKLDHYQNAILWKQLRAMCTEPLCGGELVAIDYQVLVEPQEKAPEAKNA